MTDLDCIPQHKKGKKVEFSSMDLKKRNSRIAESVQEIFMLRWARVRHCSERLLIVHIHSDKILDELFDEIRSSIACLYRCSEAIAMLDMLAS